MARCSGGTLVRAIRIQTWTSLSGHFDVSDSGHAECTGADDSPLFRVDGVDRDGLHFFDGKGTDVGAFQLTSEVSALPMSDPVGASGATLNSHVTITVRGAPSGQDCNHRFRVSPRDPTKAESIGDGCEWDGQDADGNRLHFVQAVRLETLSRDQAGIHAVIGTGSATIDIYSSDGQHAARCAYAQDVQTRKK